MKADKRMMFSVFWVILGAVLMGAYHMELVDSYWSAMGSGLFVVGMVQTIRHIRYYTDAEYKAYMDIQTGDERNRFISGRAWACAGYLYVIIGAAAGVVFKLMENDRMMQLAAGSVCMLMILYWISFLCLRRKY